MAQAAAAVTLAEDMLAATGVTMSAEEKTRVYKAELERLAGYMTGPALEAINAHIAALNLIPRSIYTVLTVSTKPGREGDYSLPSLPGQRIHDGGIAGGMSFKGLQPNEVPAILEKGEAVLTKEQQSAIGSGGMDPTAWGRMAADAFAKRMQLNGRAS
jgi:hypothetical protein